MAYIKKEKQNNQTAQHFHNYISASLYPHYFICVPSSFRGERDA